ncbi:transposase [Streptomyces chromofuscus]|uniref:transposase n=1 Tax=Streptomyces chromofuscus TaxID=42881 RepID=UPI00198DAA00|nr:transposase [Streptomyces chromofuscus]GGT02818.1 hypothetical protein GCM10010254_23920 [Streptomyces chromofuscus]
MLRAEPALFGPVASGLTVSRLVDVLAGAGPRVGGDPPSEVRSPRAGRKLAGTHAPDASGRQVVVDIDGVLVLAHSEKQDATAPWKRTFGHHPLVPFVGHGRNGSGEPLAGLLRPGNTGSNTAADHITTNRMAQLPKQYRLGRQTLIHTGSAGGTHEFPNWCTLRGSRLSYSVGMTITDAVHHVVLQVPDSAWTPAVVPDGQVRDGAWLAALAGDALKGRPAGMRRIVRKESRTPAPSCGSPTPTVCV